MANLEKLAQTFDKKAQKAEAASEQYTANDPSGCRYYGAANAYRDAAAMVREAAKAKPTRKDTTDHAQTR